MAKRQSKNLPWPDWKSLKLSRWQRRFLADPSKKKLLDAGRGAGKSFVILLDALISAMELYPERASKPFPRPGPLVVVGICAPNLKNLRDLWAALKALCPKLKGYTRDGEKRYLCRENEKTTWLFGQSRGIEIRLISAWLPNSLRSGSIDILVMDEWAFAGYSSHRKKTIEGIGKSGSEIYFQILEKMVNRAFCYGKVICASTPLGNYFDDWCSQASTGQGDFGRWSFHCASALDNDFLDAEQRAEIEAERARNEYQYRQERLGELHVVFPRHTATDLAFSSELIERVLVQKLPGVSKGPYAASCDVSWLGPDWLCILVIDLTLNTIVHVELHEKTQIGSIVAIMARIHKTFRIAPGRMGYDATGEGKSLEKMLPQEWKAEAVIFSEYKKPGLLKAVEMRLEHGVIRIPDADTFDFDTLPHAHDETPPGEEEQDQAANFAQLLAELADYRKETVVLPGGEKRVRYSKGPVIKRDDTIDSMSVLAHVMPPLILDDVKKKHTKKSLAQAFNNAYSG